MFYHPKHLQRQEICTPYPYVVKEDDLDQLMQTWIPKAFAEKIYHIYDFSPDKARIRLAKVFLSKQSRSS